MSKLTSLHRLLDGRHFDREIILLCVHWYLRYELSLRDLVEMMAERGVSLADTTILRRPTGLLLAESQVRRSRYLNNLIDV